MRLSFIHTLEDRICCNVYTPSTITSPKTKTIEWVTFLFDILSSSFVSSSSSSSFEETLSLLHLAAYTRTLQTHTHPTLLSDFIESHFLSIQQSHFRTPSSRNQSLLPIPTAPFSPQDALLTSLLAVFITRSCDTDSCVELPTIVEKAIKTIPVLVKSLYPLMQSCINTADSLKSSSSSSSSFSSSSSHTHTHSHDTLRLYVRLNTILSSFFSISDNYFSYQFTQALRSKLLPSIPAICESFNNFIVTSDIHSLRFYLYLFTGNSLHLHLTPSELSILPPSLFYLSPDVIMSFTSS